MYALGFLISVIIALVIPVIIGSIVYSDAKGRNMNAVLWTLIAVLSPMFIGLIVYLLIRGNYSNLLCPSCESQVTEQYIVCPRCGVRLKASCQKCGTLIKDDWSVCPNCAVSLADNRFDCSHPIVKKDKLVSKYLIAVFILLPILLLVPLGIGLLGTPRSSESWSSSSGTQPVSRYTDTHPEVNAWIENCTDPSIVYVLRYREEDHENYLFYSPSKHIAIEHIHPNGSGAEFYFREHLIPPAEPLLSTAQISNKSFNNIRVLINEERVDCELTEATYDFTLPILIIPIVTTPSK
ncbi:MAG: zinc ribbon domain-containing protein [Dehalococcoidia bacterium]|nr:zinc ribbon domain-containing protein [Dehalococcoidia bacterium]